MQSNKIQGIFKKYLGDTQGMKLFNNFNQALSIGDVQWSNPKYIKEVILSDHVESVWNKLGPSTEVKQIKTAIQSLTSPSTISLETYIQNAVSPKKTPNSASPNNANTPYQPKTNQQFAKKNKKKKKTTSNRKENQKFLDDFEKLSLHQYTHLFFEFVSPIYIFCSCFYKIYKRNKQNPKK